MEQKEQANSLFKEGKYEQAIKIYSDILESESDNTTILSNRSLCYIKMEQYQEALQDAVKCTKLKSDWGKAWGRLGASLYGLNKLDESLVAYNKANQLEPNQIYQDMIEQIKNEVLQVKNKMEIPDLKNISESLKSEGLNTDQLFNTMFDSVMSNPQIMEKLTNPEFQAKVLSMQNNPMEAFKDKDIMGLMGEMVKNMKF
jgi:stress-induced-phosphoprotein 1